jgi:hypothetical protein
MLKDFDPVRSSTLSEQVAKRLATRIAAVTGVLTNNSLLQLSSARALNVGHPSLQEALASLPFSGSYVAEQPSTNFSSPG